MNINESDALKTEQEVKLLEELEEERKSKVKLAEQNELLLQQWDEALAYVEQVYIINDLGHDYQLILPYPLTS